MAQRSSPWPALNLLDEGLVPRSNRPFARNGSSHHDQLVEDLVEGNIFTGWFIITYQYTLLGLLFILSVRKWLDFAVDRVAGKQHDASLQSSASSGSSATLDVRDSFSDPRGTLDPNSSNKLQLDLSDGETTRLLSSSPSRRHPGGILRRLGSTIHSIGAYQPPPMPILNRVFPSLSACLMISMFLGLNTFYLFFRVPLKVELGPLIAVRASLLFVGNLPWLYLLGAKNQPLIILTGYSYEHLNIIHRRLGELLCLLAVVHFAGMMCAWYTFLLPIGIGLLELFTKPVIYLGTGAFLAYQLLYLTSLASFRQWWYEVFLASHIFLQAAALVLLFLHHKGGRIYTLIALAVFLLDRLIFRMSLKNGTVVMDLTVMEDGETILLSADWSLVQASRRWKRLSDQLNISSGWSAAQHIFITVPALSQKQRFQAHPFTIASAAPERSGDHAWLNLIIRSRDGFTRELLRYARTHSSAAVHVDGPYGSTHVTRMLDSSDAAVLVAGGSGIAVVYPLIWRHLNCGTGSDEEQGSIVKRSSLIWVVHDASHINWIGHERLDQLREMGLHVVIPPPTKSDGRPDLEALVRESVEELIGNRDSSRISVVVSGPDGMNRTARNVCARMIWDGYNVEVAVEKFGW